MKANYPDIELQQSSGNSLKPLQEWEKWDRFYESQSLMDESEGLRSLNSEFSNLVNQFLAPGALTLEAGCGAGWQSLALARLGLYKVHLMDFTGRALDYARRIFERERVSAEYLLQDVFTCGEPAFDLVFNAGVLEHYTFEKQVEFLKGMASRSRKYVMVLVPNSYCYWYWIWRINEAGRGAWPYGKETPLINLAETFKAAGIQFLGQHYLGELWTEDFIINLHGLSDDLRQQISLIHRSGLVPQKNKAYLLAALGAVDKRKVSVPAGWTPKSQGERPEKAEAYSMMGDVLALAVNANAQITQQRQRMLELEQGISAGQEQIAKMNQQLAEREQRIIQLHQMLNKRSQPYGNADQRLVDWKMEVAQQQLLLRDQPVAQIDQRIVESKPDLARLSQRLVGQGRQLSEQQQWLNLQEQQLTERNQQLSERDRLLGELQQLVAERDQQLDEMHQQIAEQEQQLDEQRQLAVEREEQIQDLRNNLDALTREHEEQAVQLQASAQANDEIKILHEQHEMEFAELNETLQGKDQTINQLMTDLAEKSEAVTSISGQLARAEAHLAQLKEVIASNGREQTMLRETLAGQAQTLQQLNHEHGQLREELSEAKKEVEHLFEVNRGHELELTHYKREEVQYKTQARARIREIQQLNQQRDQLMAKLRVLSQEKENLDRQLETILTSRGWMLGMKANQLRQRIAPSGSRRERLIGEMTDWWLSRQRQNSEGQPDGTELLLLDHDANNKPMNGAAVDSVVTPVNQVEPAAPSEAISPTHDESAISDTLNVWQAYTNVDAERRYHELLVDHDTVRFPVCDPRKGDLVGLSRTVKVEPLHEYEFSISLLGRSPSAQFCNRFIKRILIDQKEKWSQDICQSGNEVVYFRHFAEAETIEIRVELEVHGEPEAGWKWGEAATVGVGAFVYQKCAAGRVIVDDPGLQQILDAHQHCRGIVVYLPLIDWGWMKQRPHHLLRHMARQGYLVLFCTPQLYADKVTGYQQVAPNIYLCERVEPLFDIPQPWVLVSNPRHLDTINEFAEPQVIYDCLDDLRVHSTQYQVEADVLEKHEILLRQAKIVLATCDKIYQSVITVRPDTIFCPNAVELDDFRLETTPPIPADLEPIRQAGKAVVGYYGALAKWFDFEMFAQAARLCPDYQFVLIGPDYDGSLKAQGLDQLSNIHWLGEKKYEELPAYLHYFDVATIPFQINEITKATSPVKLFEYMAGGKPIVTTSMPECCKYPSVLIAVDADDYVAKLKEAVRRGPTADYQSLLEKDVTPNTWQARSVAVCKRMFTPGPLTLESVMARGRESKGVIVFLLSIGWRIDLFQRPHHLARYFSQQGYISVYDCSAWDDDFFGFKEIEPNLILYRGSEDTLQQIPDSILWTYCYNYQKRDSYPQAKKVVYDLIDDFKVHPFDMDLMKNNHERALREADVVTYVAHELEKFMAARPDAVYLPNGVEDWRFEPERACTPSDATITRLLATGKPIAGYYGAIAEWFDYDLLEAVARMRPDWNFVLIGPNYDNSMQGRSVLQMDNVTWLGPRQYHEIPNYLQAFTVATIPFAINEITLATSPLKLYEYFAGGKPVITSPMPECMAFPEIHIVSTAQEFSLALDQALAESRDPAFREHIRQLSHEHSWVARVKTVVHSMKKNRLTDKACLQ